MSDPTPPNLIDLLKQLAQSGTAACLGFQKTLEAIAAIAAERAKEVNALRVQWEGQMSGLTDFLANLAKLGQMAEQIEQIHEYVLAEAWRLDPELVEILRDQERPYNEYIDALSRAAACLSHPENQEEDPV